MKETETRRCLGLRGIIPPLVTPLGGRDELDVAGLEQLVERVIGGGVHGVFILGSSGEGPSLSYRLRRELIERVCRLVRGRAPVLVGITDTSFVEAVSLGRFAADAGAQALVTSAPYYFPPGQPELVEWLDRLVPQLPLPLMLYNMPALTRTVFEIETLRHGMEKPGIIGVKDSSGELEYLSEVIELARQRPDWSVLVGQEHLLAEGLRRGAAGGIPGGAQIEPGLHVGMYEAACAGDWKRVEQLHARVMQLVRIYQVGRHASSFVRGLKCALSLLGVCDDFMAEPFTRFGAEERERVRRILGEMTNDEARMSNQ